MPERYSQGYRSHIRETKRLARPNLPTWDTLQVSLEIQAKSENNFGVFKKNKRILREFYNARLEKAMGLEAIRLQKFIDKYSNKKGEQLLDELAPFLSMIRDSIEPPRR